MTREKVYGVGIVGCGGIGLKRAHALGQRGKLLACADLDGQRAQALAHKFRARHTTDWRELLAMLDVEIVIVATVHDALAEIASAAVAAGKHVLVEKPAARSADELKPLLNQADVSSVKVRVGFNHRYHRAILKARTMVDAGVLGEIMFLRARYGHGGRLGYEKEWRAHPQISGGGELIDQGAHVIDLSRCFLGELTKVVGYADTYYWDMPVDDNAFMLLRNEQQQAAFLHVSCTDNFARNAHGLRASQKQG